MRTIDLDAVTLAYLTTAVWTATDEQGESLAADTPVEPFTAQAARENVANFVAAVQQERPDALDSIDDAQIGHDLLLTSEHHGAGFWDRGLGEVGEFLTRMSDGFGTDWYVHAGQLHSGDGDNARYVAAHSNG